jgi:hypothetical protein
MNLTRLTILADGPDAAAMPFLKLGKSAFDTMTPTQKDYLYQCMLAFGRDAVKRAHYRATGFQISADLENYLIEQVVIHFERP